MNRLETPWHNILAATSIVQAHVLATESALNAEKLFGMDRLPTDGLVAACQLLAELFGVLEQTAWEDE